MDSQAQELSHNQSFMNLTIKQIQPPTQWELNFETRLRFTTWFKLPSTQEEESVFIGIVMVMGMMMWRPLHMIMIDTHRTIYHSS